MATTTSIAFLPILFFGIISVVVVLAIINSLRQTKTNTATKTATAKSERRYTFAPLNQYYIPSGYSPQMELDLRLPYRKFKKLYPHSKLTYEEYKRVQKQSAFKRSVSSQENKRMVR